MPAFARGFSEAEASSEGERGSPPAVEEVSGSSTSMLSSIWPSDFTGGVAVVLVAASGEVGFGVAEFSGPFSLAFWSDFLEPDSIVWLRFLVISSMELLAAAAATLGSTMLAKKATTLITGLSAWVKGVRLYWRGPSCSGFSSR